MSLGKDTSEIADEKNILVELMKIGLPVALMNSVTAAGAMVLQYFVNLMGSAYVAAYSACMKFASLFEQFGMSVGLSMMTFVGQNKGAGKYDRIRTGVRQGPDALYTCECAYIAPYDICARKPGKDAADRQYDNRLLYRFHADHGNKLFCPGLAFCIQILCSGVGQYLYTNALRRARSHYETDLWLFGRKERI